jgi:ATP-dependent Lhr-like helicase
MTKAFSMLHPLVKEALEKKGFHSQTLPQERGIPAIVKGRNVVIIARTGSGKTESALLPIFSKILSEKERSKGIKAIYVAPLRALNRDLLNRLKWWGEELGLDVQVRHGDTTQYERRKQALSPPDILITTPETVQAMLTGKVMRENLKTVRTVVVDEVHELAPDKRGTQLSVGLERVVRLSGEFQRIGLSATVGAPTEIAGFLCGTRPCTIIDATAKTTFDIRVEFPMPEPGDEQLADELSTTPQTAARVRRIKELVDENESVLTFVNTREMAEALSSRFNLLTEDIDVHHSSLAKTVRIDTEKRFKEQELKCIICTSSMELGIDVGTVSLVIQYMSPRQVSRLIQRVGRSGHRYDETPTGIIMALEGDDILESAVIARRARAHELEAPVVYEEPFDVLAHQLLGLSMDMGDVSRDEAYELVTRAYPYRTLTRERFDSVLELLSSLRLIWLEETSYHKSKFALNYYFENLSVIPDVKKYRVVELGSNRSIGVLDEEFVVDRANIGMTFVIKGRAWNVIDVDEGIVHVEEVANIAAAPAWEGELIPVPYEIAQEVTALRTTIAERGTSIEERERLCAEYALDDAAFDEAERYVSSQKDFDVPRRGEILLEFLPALAIFHTGFGSVVNETLGRTLAALYSNKFGSSVAMKSDPYRIGFRFPAAATIDDVVSVLDGLHPEDVRPILELSLKRTNLFFWKFSHVATRFGVLSKDAEKFKVKAVLSYYEDTPVYEETLKELFTDKLDVATTEEVVRQYQAGELPLISHERKHHSPLAAPLMAKFGFGELIGPKRPEKEILKLLKKRLEERRVRLFCVHCARWHASMKVGHMSDHPKCPLCGARFIAIIDKKDEMTRKALIKRKKKQKISEEEEELVIRAKRSADLMLVYGKKAALAISARGVGAQTAARILAKMHPDEDSLLKDLLEAEKTYARTRRFWD